MQIYTKGKRLNEKHKSIVTYYAHKALKINRNTLEKLECFVSYMFTKCISQVSEIFSVRLS